MAGLSGGRDDPAVFLRPQVVRVSLWAVLGPVAGPPAVPAVCC